MPRDETGEAGGSLIIPGLVDHSKKSGNNNMVAVIDCQP